MTKCFPLTNRKWQQKILWVCLLFIFVICVWNCRYCCLCVNSIEKKVWGQPITIGDKITKRGALVSGITCNFQRTEIQLLEGEIIGNWYLDICPFSVDKKLGRRKYGQRVQSNDNIFLLTIEWNRLWIVRLTWIKGMSFFLSRLGVFASLGELCKWLI